MKDPVPLRHVLWYCLLLVGLGQVGCRKVVEKPSGESLAQLMAGVDSLVGKADYLGTPFVAAGDRAYLIGTQDGRFPDLGWHVAGEMGGIWDHPIKLLDGFTAALLVDGKAHCLDRAETFINYPFANKHIYQSAETGLRVERLQYVPDGQEAVLVEYTFHNPATEAKTIDFQWTAHTDLRPTWLGDSTGMVDSRDFARWNESGAAWIAKDSLNPWYVMTGATVAPASHGTATPACDYAPQGQGVRLTTVYRLTIPAGGALSLPITIAGSAESLEAVKQNYAAARRDAAKNLLAKKERYAQIAARSKLTLPDKQLETAFRWTKYNTDWLIREVPGQGRGLSAGLPDYPWWFGADNAYALRGVLDVGMPDLARSTVALLASISERTNGNGRIVHEVSTNGAVYNPGNLNETPQFVSLVWQVYLWTGDRKFLATYYPQVKKSMTWLLDQNDKDRNGLPDGFGMMEIHGLNSEMIDVAAYTWQALEDATQMALAMKEKDVSEKYRALAFQLKNKINAEFWVPELNAYADFVGTPAQALPLLDDAIVRADTLDKPWAVKELKAARQRIAALPSDQKQGFALHHNWVVNTPMQTGLADTAKARAALATARRFVNPYGMFVTGIDRDESAGKDTSSFGRDRKVFSYVGAVMTLPTGVQAVAENNYGRPNIALDYLRRMARTFGYALPGSMYEVSPDYGMMTQAWNLYALAVPIVGQFFGIRPQAFQKRVRIQPQMPTAWNDATLENVRIGDNDLSIHFIREEGAQQILLDQSHPEWKLTIAYPAGRFLKWMVNGKAVKVNTEGGFDFVEVEGVKVVVRVE